MCVCVHMSTCQQIRIHMCGCLFPSRSCVQCSVAALRAGCGRADDTPATESRAGQPPSARSYCERSACRSHNVHIWQTARARARTRSVRAHTHMCASAPTPAHSHPHTTPTPAHARVRTHTRTRPLYRRNCDHATTIPSLSTCPCPCTCGSWPWLRSTGSLSSSTPWTTTSSSSTLRYVSKRKGETEMFCLHWVLGIISIDVSGSEAANEEEERRCLC